MEIFSGLFAIAIAAGCFWFSFKLIVLYFKVKRWDKVIANVLLKEVKLQEKYSTGRSPYKMNIMYTYAYKKQSYNGSMIFLVELIGGQANFMKSNADNHMARINDQMNIYVNPENPEQSVMFCNGIGLYLLVFIIGVFALSYGIVELM
jgi:hypothetical protein